MKADIEQLGGFHIIVMWKGLIVFIKLIIRYFILGVVSVLSIKAMLPLFLQS